MMIPEQEHALRDPEFQRRIAKAIAEGLEHFCEREMKRARERH